MFFRGEGGSLFSSRDGDSVEITEEDPQDIVDALVVPGFHEFHDDVKPQSWSRMARYTADFEGIKDDTTLLAQWKSCCSD